MEVGIGLAPGMSQIAAAIEPLSPFAALEPLIFGI